MFRRRRFFKGQAQQGGVSEVGDIAWFNPGGTPMTHDDWSTGYARSVTVFLNGDRILEPGPRGERIVDDSFLVMFNAHYEPLDIVVPPAEYGTWWTLVLDTADGDHGGGDSFGPGAVVTVEARSTVVLSRPVSAVAPATAESENTAVPPAPARKQDSRAATLPTARTGGVGWASSALPAPKPALRRH